MMDFPVLDKFVAAANVGQLHDECMTACGSRAWPASFVHLEDGWVYRVDEAPTYVTGPNPLDPSGPFPVVVDAEKVKAVIAAHRPVVAPTLAEQIDALPNPTQDLAGFKTALKDVLGA